MRQYFNSRKTESTNQGTPSQLKKYIQQAPKPSGKNPFFESSEPEKITNIGRNRAERHHASPNNVFYHQAKPSGYHYQNGREMEREQTFGGKNAMRVNNTRKDDYVINNFVNIHNLNIKNYYPDQKETGQKKKSKLD